MNTTNKETSNVPAQKRQNYDSQLKRTGPYFASQKNRTQRNSNQVSTSTGQKFDTTVTGKRETDHIPPLKDGDIRIIHLGGVEEIGRNMSLVEYKDTILVIDCGVQFTETNTPGIDFILPNTRYLEERKHKIKGVLVTHGHLDHIGSIPYIMPRIGNPQIYSRLFTSLMIKKRQEEFPHLAPLTINVVEKGDSVTLGDLKVRFFSVDEEVPAELGLIIETPYGDIVHTGDLRLQHADATPTEAAQEEYKVFENRKTLLLMADSVGSENSGLSLTRKETKQHLEKCIQKAGGRIILATFSSQVEKLLDIVELAKKYNRKIVLEGKTMLINKEAAREANLISPSEDIFIRQEQLPNYEDNAIIIVTSAQEGEEFSSLGRIANKTHRLIKISSKDTVIMSSAVTPGIRRTIQVVKDKFSREGVRIVEWENSDLYSSGHAYADELVWMHNRIAPKFFIPIHGCHYMLRVHSDIKRRQGLPENALMIPDNGMIIEITNEGRSIGSLKEKAPSDIVVVDGTSVGKIQDVVMRDRQTLAEDGMFVVIGVIDSHTHTLKKSPDLISRGFVYLKESQELLYQTRLLTKKVIDESLSKGGYSNLDQMKQDIAEATTKFLLQKTAKRPVIIPVIISV